VWGLWNEDGTTCHTCLPICTHASCNKPIPSSIPAHQQARLTAPLLLFLCNQAEQAVGWTRSMMLCILGVAGNSLEVGATSQTLIHAIQSPQQQTRVLSTANQG
jgi:hypothetical protein